MNGQDQLRAAATGLARVLANKATGTPARPIRVGIIAGVNSQFHPVDGTTERVAVITGVPGLQGNPLTVPEVAWSSAFRADVAAAEAAAAAVPLDGSPAPGLTGRAVEIHFTDDQPVIAYTLGG